MSEHSSPFEQAVVALLDALELGHEFERCRLESVIDGLSSYLRATSDGIDRETLLEIVDVALLEFIEQARAGKVDRRQSPAGYLIKLARWRALDHFRRAARDRPLGELDEPDDQEISLAQSLDAIVSEEQIGKLIHRNRLSGRHDLNQIVGAWLNLADHGQPTTLRNIGAKVGLAPSTVAAKLAEIRVELSSIVT
jgi:hypothetical protein